MHWKRELHEHDGDVLAKPLFDALKRRAVKALAKRAFEIAEFDDLDPAIRVAHFHTALKEALPIGNIFCRFLAVCGEYWSLCNSRKKLSPNEDACSDHSS
jgi:hypothetical protein